MAYMSNEANRWKALREIAGLSQREVGRRAGINSGRMSVIERGLVPTAEEAAKLTAVLVAATLPKGDAA